MLLFVITNQHWTNAAIKHCIYHIRQYIQLQFSVQQQYCVWMLTLDDMNENLPGVLCWPVCLQFLTICYSVCMHLKCYKFALFCNVMTMGVFHATSMAKASNSSTMLWFERHSSKAFFCLFLSLFELKNKGKRQLNHRKLETFIIKGSTRRVFFNQQKTLLVAI